MERNLKAKASSKNPKTTLTEFNQPPDFGKEFNQPGKIANKVNGMAKAKENANIPKIGLSNAPPAELIRIEPTMGPVQEKETKTKVKAIKKMPVIPPLSDFSSILFTKLLGKVNSNIPKKAMAKKINTRKKNTFGTQCVESQLANSGPCIDATAVPAMV